jgi:tRNA(Ile)-lysidine synthase TilS/MesJ
MIRILHIDFRLAKLLYKEWHRHCPNLTGHRKSFLLIEDTEKWKKTFSVSLMNGDELNLLNWYVDDYEHENQFIIKPNGDDDEQFLWSFGKIIGICSIGNPVARFKDKKTFELNRVCYAPNWKPKTNTQRKYHSKLIREAVKEFSKYHHWNKIITYIHEKESGNYLYYAGFKEDKIIKYSENAKGWNNRPNRNKADKETKIRFVLINKANIKTAE